MGASNVVRVAVSDNRVLRVKTIGSSKYEDPFIHYPLDEATNDYVQKELAVLSPFGKLTQLHTDSIISLNTEKVAQDIEWPLFVAHGKDNLLHPVDESIQFFEAAAEPKELYIIDGKHNDFMYHEHPVFQDLVGELKEFFGKNLSFVGFEAVSK